MSTTVGEFKPHPLSRDFTWSMPAPNDLRYLSTEQYRAFDKNGLVKLEAVFTPAEVTSVIAAIDPIEQKGEAWLRGKGGKVKSRKQAIAIALSESGSTNRKSPQKNRQTLSRTKSKERSGRTAEAEKEGRAAQRGTLA